MPRHRHRHPQSFIACLSFAALGTGCAEPAETAAPPLSPASSPDEIRSVMESRAEAFLKERDNVGIAIGLTRGPGDRLVVLRGEVASTPNAQPVEAATLFEIGSISKTVTALLTAEAVVDGAIRLDQPITEILGDRATMPLAGGKPVTVLDLATHHAGFPRLPENLRLVTDFFKVNPYANYSEDELFAAVTMLGEAKPGQDEEKAPSYAYSNFGYSVLAHGIALARDRPLAALHADLFARLGMNDTWFREVPENARDRLAIGHRGGREIPYWHDGGELIQGAGSVVSTLGDQLTWLEAHLSPPDGPAGDAARLAVSPRRSAGKGGGRIALGWHITGGALPIAWHNGGTGGFHSFAGFVADPPLGVVVLVNTSDDKADQIGLDLLRELTPRPAAAR